MSECSFVGKVVGLIIYKLIRKHLNWGCSSLASYCRSQSQPPQFKRYMDFNELFLFTWQLSGFRYHFVFKMLGDRHLNSINFILPEYMDVPILKTWNSL